MPCSLAEDTHIDGGSFTPGDWATPIPTDQKCAVHQSRYEGKAEEKISSPTENRATLSRAYISQFSQYTNYTRYKVSTFNLLFTVLPTTVQSFLWLYSQPWLCNCSLLQRNVHELYVGVLRLCHLFDVTEVRGGVHHPLTTFVIHQSPLDPIQEPVNPIRGLMHTSES
jgi:hypothetical protein